MLEEHVSKDVEVQVLSPAHMTQSLRQEVVHALTSSSLFRREAKWKRKVIANPYMSKGERRIRYLIIDGNIKNLAVTQRREATDHEINEAFARLANRSLGNVAELEN